MIPNGFGVEDGVCKDAAFLFINNPLPAERIGGGDSRPIPNLSLNGGGHLISPSKAFNALDFESLTGPNIFRMRM
jgi:hypothetical protein